MPGPPPSTELMYHAADPRERGSIARGGLDHRQETKRNWRLDEPPERAAQYPPGNYLWADKETAILAAETWSDVWAVDVQGLPLKEDPIRALTEEWSMWQGAWYSDEPIAPERLSLIGTPEDCLFRSWWRERHGEDWLG